MNGNPTCSHCGRLMVWIGISGSAEACCPVVDCKKKCPHCLSKAIEQFHREPSMFFGVPVFADNIYEMHCIDCGKVW